MKHVAVIGAAGHVGLPFSLVLAEAGYNVFGIDINWQRCDGLNVGIIPFVEEGAEELLAKVKDNIFFENSPEAISRADIIVVIIGTPVDSEGNPRLDDIMKFVEFDLIPYMQVGQLIILRSTVAPGTTELIAKFIEEKMGWVNGAEFDLVFCPERVAQGQGIRESKVLPQLIGAFTTEAFARTHEFFAPFNDVCVFLTPKEAELAKLVTNMYRYVNFAFSNEVFSYCLEHEVDAVKIIEASNLGYKRMQMPMPGPNVGGPCLFKDGKFLKPLGFGTGMIDIAFNMNESMPGLVFDEVRKAFAKANHKPMYKLMILGMTFKAESDDTRNSLSYKLKKICKIHGIEVVTVDPHLNMKLKESDVIDCDAFVVMTPHEQFNKDISKIIAVGKKKAIICDVWRVNNYTGFNTNGIGTIENIIKQASDNYMYNGEFL
jgi:UDP-N-acetyl-D-mannosaminuronic acid dehydrogenase